MENGEIANGQITQETGTHKGGTDDNAPWQARLNNPSGNTWVPAAVSRATLIVDLISVRRILAIDAHGSSKYANKPGYPTNFVIQYQIPITKIWTTVKSVSLYLADMTLR